MPIFGYLFNFFQCVLIATAWDIAVVTKEDIEFFNNGTYIGVGYGHLKDLSVAAYDPVGGYIYVSDSSHPNTSIFRLDTRISNAIDPSLVTFEPIVSKQPSVQGIAYDPVSMTLFWTTGTGNTIHKLVLRPENQTKIFVQHPGTVVHNFDGDTVPRGIAVDSCSEIIYWTNIKPERATIERSRFDGSDRAMVIVGRTNSKVKISQPYGLEIDQEMRKLYWCDTFVGNMYQIARSNLDGSSATIVVTHSGQEPQGISLVGDFLYWTDSVGGQLFSALKTHENSSKANLVKKLGRTKRPDGIISNTLYLNVKTDLCPRLAPILPQIQRLYRLESPILSHSILNTSKNLSNADSVCLNGGHLIGNSCQCPTGFTGFICEQTLCHNYCVFGSCQLSDSGTPNCKCDRGWIGSRCEIKRCENYCLNDGQCDLDNNGKPSCHCGPGYSGDRCELRVKLAETICKIICHRNASELRDFKDIYSILPETRIHSCNCPKHEANSSNTVFSRTNDSILLILILAGGCILLSGLVLVITSKYLKLRRRPRVRKRIVVNKPPLTTSCRSPTTPEPYQITIENCCNMDICDTPCFEPEFRTSKPTFSKKKKGEDKQSLISSSFRSNSQEEEDN